MTKTMIIILAVPFSADGTVWILCFLGYNISIGVCVGLIALMGVHGEFLTPTRRDSITLKTRGHKPKPEGRYANVKRRFLAT